MCVLGENIIENYCYPSMSTFPRLSIVVSVYNGAEYLEQMIDSILAQTFTEYELIIVDDGSTDATPAILERYAAKDTRIRIIQQENQGTPVALNHGIAAAQTDIIVRMDADDRMLPYRLEKQLAYFEAHPEATVISCLAYYINDQNKIIGKNYTDLYTIEDCKRYIREDKIIFCLHPGAMFRKSPIMEIGGYRSQLRYAQDMDLWNRLGDHGYYTIVMPEILVEYRIHPKASMNKAVQRSDMDKWIIDGIHRRRRGEKELTFDEYRNALQTIPWWQRLKRKWIIYRNIYYRTAGLMYGNRRYGQFLRYMFLACLLGPHYVFFKLRHQLSLKHHLSLD